MRDKLLESIKQLIEKTSISPEDKADNDALKSIYLKRLDRRNAKLTDEEKSLLQKYGLKTDGSDIGPSHYVGTPRGNVFSNRRDRAGSFNKINYADRARKIKNRIERDIIGKNEYDRPIIIDGSSNKVNNYNELRNLEYSRQMQKNVNKMNHYLNKRRIANLELDSIDSRRASREANIKAKYDSEIKNLNRWYDYTKQSSTDDIAQSTDEINKLLKRKPQTESLSEVEDKAREAQNPVYADAIRGIKRADKAREEYRKLPKAEEREENPKVKGNSDMKKMYLSESLFEDYDEPSDYLVIVYEDGESSIEGADQYTIDDMCAELEYMPDEELEQRKIAGWARLYLDDDGYIRRFSSYAREDEFEELVKNTIRTYEHKVDESLNEDVNKINSTEDMLIQIVGDEYESGHILYDNIEQLKDDLINSFNFDFSNVDFDSLWTLYMEMHDMGPEGFYHEYGDKYHFSDDFKGAYGLDDLDESLDQDTPENLLANFLDEAHEGAYCEEGYEWKDEALYEYDTWDKIVNLFVEGDTVDSYINKVKSISIEAADFIKEYCDPETWKD